MEVQGYGVGDSGQLGRRARPINDSEDEVEESGDRILKAVSCSFQVIEQLRKR